MSLNRGEINPLGVLKLRKLTFIPEHFKTVTVDYVSDIKLLEHWIIYNLNSRYAIKNILKLNDNNKLTEVTEIGIEDPREITMLTLACPYFTTQNIKE